MVFDTFDPCFTKKTDFIKENFAGLSAPKTKMSPPRHISHHPSMKPKIDANPPLINFYSCKSNLVHSFATLKACF